MSKDYKSRAQNATAALLSDVINAQGTQEARGTQKAKGPKRAAAIMDRPGTVTPRSGAPYYKINLKMPLELSAYIEEEAWRQRLTRTELINRILKSYMEEHPHE